jgi:glycosyltransferase involved in cell wall biosynthesis
MSHLPEHPASPRVSVVIPCFNLGAYLPEAVASVHGQTFRDFEIIVVDDGSTDPDTVHAIASIGESDAAGGNVRLLRSDNRGLSAARNLGIAHARGSLISCLDADDMFEPEWLERGVDRLDTEPELAFVSHWLEAFGDTDGQWTPGRSDLAALLDQNVFNGAALFRRSLVDSVGGFDESMRDGCEDWEFWIRVMEAGHRGAIVPDTLYRYRRRPDSMSRAMTDGDTWFRLFGLLIEKHPVSYQEHLIDLLLRREWTIGRLLLGIDAVQDELSTVLEPATRSAAFEIEHARGRLETARLREDLATVRARAQTLEAQVHSLESRLDDLASVVTERESAVNARNATIQRLESERLRLESTVQGYKAANRNLERHVADLHHSWSWRVTAPFRRIYEWLRFR